MVSSEKECHLSLGRELCILRDRGYQDPQPSHRSRRRGARDTVAGNQLPWETLEEHVSPSR